MSRCSSLPGDEPELIQGRITVHGRELDVDLYTENEAEGCLFVRVRAHAFTVRDRVVCCLSFPL